MPSPKKRYTARVYDARQREPSSSAVEACAWFHEFADRAFCAMKEFPMSYGFIIYMCNFTSLLRSVVLLLCIAVLRAIFAGGQRIERRSVLPKDRSRAQLQYAALSKDKYR